MKRIALFIDGTWNSDERPNTTNVYKLHELAVDDGRNQIKRYFAGVGTRGSCIYRALGGASGLGASQLIRDAYAYACERYEKGDLIFLFGFSRGGFIARSLAGFFDAVGLLLKEHASTDLVEEAFRLYEKQKSGQESALKDFLRRISGEAKPSAEDNTLLPIYFIGVWDTVATLGVPGRDEWTARYTEFHQTELPSNVTHARHALAIHERRQYFEPLLWSGTHPKGVGQTLAQVWFPGSHGDVGGGFRNSHNANVALAWMAAEATCPDGDGSDRGLLLEHVPWPSTPPSEKNVHDTYDFRFCRLSAGIRLLPRRTRPQLEMWRDSENARTVDTFYFHQTFSDHLVALSKSEQGYQFGCEVSSKMRAADRAAFRMLVALSRAEFRWTGLGPWVKSGVAECKPTDGPEWLQKLDAEKVLRTWRLEDGLHRLATVELNTVLATYYALAPSQTISVVSSHAESDVANFYTALETERGDYAVRLGSLLESLETLSDWLPSLGLSGYLILELTRIYALLPPACPDLIDIGG